jgi:hypothetical protein
MEQMMEHLLAKLVAMQEVVVSHHEEMMAEIRAWQKEMKADQETPETYQKRWRQIHRK